MQISCVASKKVWVAREMVFWLWINDNRGNQGDIRPSCDWAQFWYLANCCLWFMMARDFFHNRGAILQLWLRRLWQRITWCIGQIFKLLECDIADIVTKKALSVQMPTTSFVFFSASPALLNFHHMLLELDEDSFSIPLLFSWLLGFSLDLELLAKLTVYMFSFKRRISSTSKVFVRQFTKCQEFFSFSGVIAQGRWIWLKI